MVMSEKASTSKLVSVRFPSLHSLKPFLSENGRLNNQLPKYYLEPETASTDVLSRRREEISERSFCRLGGDDEQAGVITRRRFESPVKKNREIHEGGGDELEDETSSEAEPNVMKNRRRKVRIKTQKPKHHQQQLRRMVKASVARLRPAVRYKIAEVNMLKVLKAKRATALRNDHSRKLLIGDMIGSRVAPGGADRSRRRHNADGTLMEYSLESTTDLVEIRNESGVQYSSQDPICATMLKELWNVINNLNKEEMECKQPEQALAMVTTTSNPLVTCMDWDQAYSSGIQQKDKYAKLAVSRRTSKFEEHVRQLSQILYGMEMGVDYRLQEEIMAMKSTLEESAPPVMYYSERADIPKMTDKERGVIEAKTINLKRLRCGFCIHWPHETFLSTVPTTPHSVFVTPPARPAMPLNLVLTQSPYVSSPGSSSGSLVTPFAERYPVMTSTLLCNAANRPSPSPSFARVASAIEKITSLYQSAKIHRIYVNGIAGDAKDNAYTAITRKHTYQRRHQLDEIKEIKSTTEVPGAALMYYSEAAVPQLKDDARGVKDDKPTKLETLRSGCRICRPPGTFLWPNMNMSMSQHQANRVLPRSLRGLNHGSSSGSLVKPYAERRPVNTITLLCNVTYPSSRSPAFSRVQSEAKDANTRFSPTNLGDVLVKRYDDMRRHNTEYVVDISKEAGVQGTPPQAWKPGDDSRQNPICATLMFKDLWDDIANLKKREKEYTEPEQALAMVTTTSNSLVTGIDSDQAYSSVIQDKYTQPAISRSSKFEKQMHQRFLYGMEKYVDYRLHEEIMSLNASMEEPAAPLMNYSETVDLPQMRNNERRVIEAKATKLERLRSGFRIRRPHERFLSAVPTTPYSVFVTSSTKPAMPLDLVLTQSPYAPSPGSSSRCLVTPYAEGYPVNTSTLLCNDVNRPSLSPDFTGVASNIEKITSLYQSAKIHRINLNGIEFTAIYRNLTYQRRHQLDEIKELKWTIEAPGSAVMYHSEAAVPQLKDNERGGVSEFKAAKLETRGTFLCPNMNMSVSQHQIDPLAVPTTPSTIIQQDLVLPRSLRGLNLGSSSGSLVKPFPKRLPVNTTTLLCNVTNPPAFSRVPSETKNANSLFSPINLVLKAKGATAGNPIKMPALTNETRKLIDDTGLLKHMAGKVAHCGADRHCRRRNADGQMEYCLESTADFVEIRKEAGVQDPSQDPICATMFKKLWDKIDNLKKREKESKEPEQALVMDTTTSNSLVTRMDLDQAYSSVIQLKDKYTQVAVRKSKFAEQMQQASETLSGMEDEIMALKSTMEIPATALVYNSEAADVPQLLDNERWVIEANATKLGRLRSGFKICRPHGTFLSAVPTTPYSIFITSSTKSAVPLDLVLARSPYAPSPGSSSGCLITPFAERIPVNTELNVANRPSLSPALTLKGTTAIAHIGEHHIHVASDQRGSFPHYEIAGIQYPGGKRVTVAVLSLMERIHDWEIEAGEICEEEFLVIGRLDGQSIIYKVKSMYRGGVEFGMGIGATVVIGSGCAAAYEFLQANQHSLLDGAVLVESAVVVASTKDPGTGGFVDRCRIPTAGNQGAIFERAASILQLLERDFPRYEYLLLKSLLFLCDSLDYTPESDRLLLQALKVKFPASRIHVVSREHAVIRMIVFYTDSDTASAWSDVQNGLQLGPYKLWFYQPTLFNIYIIRHLYE